MAAMAQGSTIDMMKAGGRVHPDDEGAGAAAKGPPVDAKAIANKMKSRKTAMKFLNELMLYLLWTFCFTSTIILTRDNVQAYQFNDLFKAYVLDEAGWRENLKTVDDFWEMVGDITYKVLANDIFTTAGDDFSSADTGFLYGNRRMGPMRIRQVRVPSRACSDIYFKKILVTEDQGLTKCYGEFDSSMTLENSFLKEDPDFAPDLDAQPWFKLRDKEELREMSYFSAGFSTYPGAGYVLDISGAQLVDGEVMLQTAPFATDTVRSLNVSVGEVKRSRWIDLKTRAVFIDFSFYNPNLNQFLVARIATEFLPSGIVGIYPTFRVVNPFNIFKMESTLDLIVLCFYGISGLLSAVYFFQEIWTLFKTKTKYFKNGWSVLALLHAAVMLFVFYLKFINFTEVNSMFGGDEEIAQGDLQSLGYILDQEKNLSGIAVIMMWMRLYKFCSVSRALSTLVRTLGKCAMSLSLFMCVYFLSLFGFAVGTTLLFGADAFHFNSTTQSLMTLVRATFGDIDYTDWMSNRVVGPLLLLFWLFFSNAILFNIIVAIICDGFSNVIIENEELDEKGVKSVIGIFLESGILGHRLSKMLSTKKQELGDIENALDLMDGDGDGLTDMAELQAWLTATGADKTLEEPETNPSQSIEAMMTMMSNMSGGGGGGYSSGMEERVLNIENKVGALDTKLDKIMASLEAIVETGLSANSGGTSNRGTTSRGGGV
ncbi:Polycystin cation channel-domain-containing protein [Baffinella frigidus]|nr:Polycystin cation channel-domain-containing protein [Cryptophyta sp. CCMP2293]